MSVTFATACYEADWEIILKSDYLKNKIEMCNYCFDRKILVINNVNDLKTVLKYAEKAKVKGVIDDYYVADDYTDEVLEFFGMAADEFPGKTIYYAIGVFVSLYFCNTDYFVYFTGDSRIEKKYKYNFVRGGVGY